MKSVFVLAALINTAFLAQASEPTIGVHYSGTLVADPCIILPGDEEISLEFGSVIDKYLYLNQRTIGKLFQINLSECDLSLGNTVKVSFTGVESTALPGLLAIDGNSTARGVAVGIETLAGEPLPLNKDSGSQMLTPGSNSLSLMAYIQGEPQAIEEKSITLGTFSATATFNLEYE
ncbi:fimbrial protein [Enterobacter cloacae]|uniref:fimbrial protein n=1 Tax=Enterobacter cloacae TaxID=550 RepID=UPI00345CB0DE